MPRPGGPADKLGNHYESLWTVHKLMDVAAEKADALTLEPLSEARGVEFHLERAGTTEYHSVKRQAPGNGAWTFGALCGADAARGGRSVLGDLAAHLAGALDRRAVFVSSSSADWLRELVDDRAGPAPSLGHVLTSLGSSHELRDRFVDLCNRVCGGSRVAGFDLLKRLRPVAISEDELRQMAEQQIAFATYRVDGGPVDAGDVRRTLAEWLLKNQSRRITAADVWGVLAEEGIRRQDWSRPGPEAEALAASTRAYLDRVGLELVNSAMLARREAAVVLDHLRGAGDRQFAVLSGPAGYGKSCVLAQAIASLEELPCLALRMDEVGACGTPQELGELLGLTRSPVVTLAGVARGGPCALVIDQLDAVSGVSGRAQERWPLFDALRREAARYPAMRVVLACRQFDLEHDQHLRLLTSGSAPATRIPLELLTVDAVQAELARAGMGAPQRTPREFELLRVPLHLYLMIHGGPVPPVGFVTPIDLFDRFYDDKLRRLRDRLGAAARPGASLERLVDVLSGRQSTSADAAVLDEFDLEREALLSEHLLVRDPLGRLRCFHDTFFDYLFARRFVARGQDLVRFLTAGSGGEAPASENQHLFRRAQVRQVLAYKRQRDRRGYLADLQGLLTGPCIRFHLRRVAMTWLGGLVDPWDEEWAALEALLGQPDMGWHVLDVLWNSLHWFDFLHAQGVLRRWLQSANDADVDRALRLMARAPDPADERTASIARLLAPFRGRGDPWPDRLAAVIHYLRIDAPSGSLDLLLQLIADGTLDQAARVDGRRPLVWDILRKQQHLDQADAVRVIAAWLDRRTQRAQGHEHLTPFDIELYGGRQAGGVILKAARAAPEAFTELLLPRVALLARSHSRELADGQVRDRCWLRYGTGKFLEAKDELLEGLAEALAKVAADRPALFEERIQRLEELPQQTVAYLLLRGFTGDPARSADRAAAFMAADPHRLQIDLLAASGGSAAFSHRALREVAPHLSAIGVAALEGAIIGFVPLWERDDDRRRGWSELLLLRAVGPEHLSERGQARLAELERKFPGQPTPELEGIDELVAVGSPIDGERAERLSDDEWLEAMAEYPDDRRRPDRPFEHGGALELSRVLQRRAQAQPERFAALALRMPGATNPLYFEAVVRGAAGMLRERPEGDEEAPLAAPPPWVGPLLQRVHALPGRPCGAALCDAVGAMATRALDGDLLAVLGFYAQHDPDPAEDRWHRGTDGREPLYPDPMSQGINTVRGRAAEALAHLLFAEGCRAATLRPVLEHLAGDRTSAVRSIAIEGLTALLNTDRDAAVELFIRACEGRDELLGCDTADRFLKYATWTHYPRLRPMLLAGLASPDPKAARVAAAKVCLAGLDPQRTGADAEEMSLVLGGGEPVRCAAAMVFTHNLDREEVASACAAHLPALFQDPSPEVGRALARGFGALDGPDLLAHAALIARYVEGPAYLVDPWDLIRALANSSAPLPQVTCRAAERAVAAAGDEASSVQLRGLDGRTLATLVIRLYTQSSDEAIRVRCLDLIDAMERDRFYGVDAELAGVER